MVVTDSTSVNLFKVLSAALTIARADDAGAQAHRLRAQQLPDRPVHRRSAGAASAAWSWCWPSAEDLPRLLDARCAVLMLTHVNYRTGRMHDMAALTRAAHAAGALALWDLAHSAGAVPVDLARQRRRLRRRLRLQVPERRPRRAGLRLGAPRHAERFWQPLAGWMGHAAPFEFTPGYRPAPGIRRYLCGTPPVLSLAALECGVDTVLAAEPLGGMAALRAQVAGADRAFADAGRSALRRPWA